MYWTMIISAGLAALLHIQFFILESVLWGKPISNKTFRVSENEIEVIRTWAFNQGFYNFLLAIGNGVGIFLVLTNRSGIGYTFLVSNCSIMLGAALVLVVSKPQMWRGAIIQGLPPALFLTAFWLY